MLMEHWRERRGRVHRKGGQAVMLGAGVTLSLIFEQNHSGSCVENQLKVSWRIHSSL